MKTPSRRCDAAGAGRRGFFRRPAAIALLLTFLPTADVFPLERPPVPQPFGAAAAVRRPLEPGATAPGFLLKDVAGEPFDFEAEKTKSTVLLVFFSMFCEPCRRELAVSQRIQERFGNAGLRVVAVSLDGEPLRSSVAGFARQEGYGFRVLVDEIDARYQFKAADLFGIAEIPSTFLVEKGGRILLGRKGAASEGEIEKLLQPAKKP
jgi:peroxiredoxin